MESCENRVVMGKVHEWDAFVSHASEDIPGALIQKRLLARPEHVIASGKVMPENFPVSGTLGSLQTSWVCPTGSSLAIA
jgi:hypothetical protein